jgi:hypothetical protein
MGTDAFNGSGSRFNSRFVQGEQTYAKQLNDLAAGVQASLPTPYLGGGTVVSYIPGGSIITSLPDQQASSSFNIEQFKVVVDGNNLKIAKGRVLARTLTSSPTPFPTQLVEYSLNFVAVYPTGARSSGSIANSPWMTSDGFVILTNYAHGGADTYCVYIIRNQFESETGTPGYPYAAVMVPGSDAENKSRPWFPAATHGDVVAWRHIFVYQTATVSTLDPPYEVTFNGEISQDDKLVNYNCQRVKVATVNWNTDTNSWDVTQHLIGTITLPDQMISTGTLRYDNDTPGDPPWAAWPLYSSKNDDWNGAWTGYDKSFSGATSDIGV